MEKIILMLYFSFLPPKFTLSVTYFYLQPIVFFVETHPNVNKAYL